MTNSVEQHRQEAPDTVSCLIVTVSDTRTKDNDTSGQLMHKLLTESGYQIVDYIITPDETETIRSILQDAAVRDDIEAVLLSGGTGIAPAIRHMRQYPLYSIRSFRALEKYSVSSVILRISVLLPFLAGRLPEQLGAQPYSPCQAPRERSNWQWKNSFCRNLGMLCVKYINPSERSDGFPGLF